MLVYFAGHGLTRRAASGDEVGLIVPYGAQPGRYSQAIEMGYLVDQSKFIPAKHILFVLDACFSGLAFTRGAEIGERLLDDLMTRRAVQAIAAGQADQQVADLFGPEGHSIFTGLLLDRLTQRGGMLTGNELGLYLQRHVGANTHSRQTPHYGHLLGSHGGDFVFWAEEAPVVTLPADLRDAVASPQAWMRQGAVSGLARLLDGQVADLADLARAELERLSSSDDSLSVRAAAAQVLEQLHAAPPVVEPTPQPQPMPPAAEPVLQPQPAPPAAEPEPAVPPRKAEAATVALPSTPRRRETAPPRAEPAGASGEAAATPAMSIWLIGLLTALAWGAANGLAQAVLSSLPAITPTASLIASLLRGAVGSLALCLLLRRAYRSLRWQTIGLIVLAWSAGLVVMMMMVYNPVIQWANTFYYRRVFSGLSEATLFPAATWLGTLLSTFLPGLATGYLLLPLMPARRRGTEWLIALGWGLSWAGAALVDDMLVSPVCRYVTHAGICIPIVNTATFGLVGGGLGAAFMLWAGNRQPRLRVWATVALVMAGAGMLVVSSYGLENDLIRLVPWLFTLVAYQVGVAMWAKRQPAT